VGSTSGWDSPLLIESNDSGSSFAAGCMRNLLPGSAPISLQWFSLHLSFSNICKATTVTHTNRIDRNLLRKETSFVRYTSSVLLISITYCCAFNGVYADHMSQKLAIGYGSVESILSFLEGQLWSHMLAIYVGGINYWRRFVHTRLILLTSCRHHQHKIEWSYHILPNTWSRYNRIMQCYVVYATISMNLYGFWNFKFQI